MTKKEELFQIIMESIFSFIGTILFCIYTTVFIILFFICYMRFSL